MGSSHPSRYARAAVLLCLTAASFLSLHAQSPDQFASVAGQVTDAVTASHQQRILLVPLQGCLLDPAICAALDSQVRNELKARNPGVQLAGREELLPVVHSSRLLQIDAYNEWAVQRLVEKTPSKILIVENLRWRSDGFDVVCAITDVGKHRDLGSFGAKVTLSTPETQKGPLIVKDPDSGVALVVERASQDLPYATGRGRITASSATDGQHLPRPQCLECSIGTITSRNNYPHGSEADLVLLYTVTENGSVKDVDVVHPIDSELTDETVKAVSRWRFKPAEGSDGMPFATRQMMVEPFHFN